MEPGAQATSSTLDSGAVGTGIVSNRRPLSVGILLAILPLIPGEFRLSGRRENVVIQPAIRLARPSMSDQAGVSHGGEPLGVHASRHPVRPVLNPFQPLAVLL